MMYSPGTLRTFVAGHSTTSIPTQTHSKQTDWEIISRISCTIELGDESKPCGVNYVCACPQRARWEGKKPAHTVAPAHTMCHGVFVTRRAALYSYFGMFLSLHDFSALCWWLVAHNETHTRTVYVHSVAEQAKVLILVYMCVSGLSCGVEKLLRLRIVNRIAVLPM